MSLVIVGIGGPSSSGKTTVARALHSLLPKATLIHLDDFYYPDDQIPMDSSKNVENWDCPEAIDWEKFKAYIKELRSNDGASLPVKSLEMDTPLRLNDGDVAQLQSEVDTFLQSIEGKRLIFVEGFMLFHDREVSSLFDKKLFFHGPHDVLKERRESRPGYQTVDGFWEDPPNYFDNIVWPEYRRTHSHLFINGDVEGELNDESKQHGIADYSNDGTSNLVQLTQWALEKMTI
ncbi:hypothetical protein FT663_00056 [Candidozyma haemuli var. vulneris]|uniref:Phosphoribulokinase/uridine kinase domain-containing protein n=1 Tax=Candidozyma haemuli TaxID=45357 RepID=A0A2V1AUR8_9ASCO|nr:hypothetical protein CXQ85_000844 [[Candida] haemuloni]KAF3994036.1 hypothetical protein FT662_00222 [[Candida] haemuloni var. vulneris]KAF3995833.1 hypothetical protein FT663_00056 [[Candida] haemuloni var. vulneris]PVH21850.1 hypothetical protein CXQ85_000844 [[Candida] haemuloni]